MKYLVRFFVIILITICSISNAEKLSIVYVDMEKVMNQSIAGKTLSRQIEEIHKANLEEFKKNEEELKKEEVLILSQKNVLSEADYKNKTRLYYGKIRSAFSSWIKKPEIEKYILGVEQASMGYGADGAFFVYLRKKPRAF